MSIAEVASLTERRQRSGRTAPEPGQASRKTPRGGPRTVRVVVVHGDPPTRDRLAERLHAEGIEVVGGVADVESSASFTPDVVVVLYGVPGAATIESCASLVGTGAGVVVVANAPRALLVRRAVQTGVTGFVDASSEPEVLRAAVRWVSRGQPFFDPAVGRLVVELIGRTPSSERPYGLTRAQLDVVALLPQGLPNRLIAAELGISENTVKTHLRHALRKLGVRDRAQAAALVVREGLA